MMRTPAWLPVFVVAMSTACGGPGPASDWVKPPEFNPPGQTKCKVRKSQNKPLVVEWPSGDRAELEARTRTGIVALRYDGCELEILPECQLSGAYAYTPVTPKTDMIAIRDEDQLYANLPVGAAGLEGTLKRAGQLNVSMVTVGRYVSLKSAAYRSELQGDCARATHILSGFSVGAFEMYTGADGTASASASVLGAGAGVENRTQRTTLTADGDRDACRGKQPAPYLPPTDCGALIRIETSALLDENEARAAHNRKSRVGTWLHTGKTCGGVAIYTPGVRQVLQVSETELTATIATKDCTLTNAHVPIRGDEAIVGSGQIKCSPNPCTLAYSIAANDGSKADFEKKCPDDFPIVMPVSIGGGGDLLILVTGDAQLACAETFVRQSGAPTPTQSNPLHSDPGPRARSEVPANTEPSRLPNASADAADVGPSRTTGYVLGGVAATGLAVSAVTGAMTLGKKNTIDAECDPVTRTCSEAGLDAVESGRTLSTVSTVSFVAGTAALGLAIYFLLNDPEKPRATQSPHAGATRSTPRYPFVGVRW